MNNKVEEWKPVSEFDGKYEVSSLGRVRRVNPLPVHIVKTYIDTYGYTIVPMRVNGVNYKRRLARLMATAFIREPNTGEQVNHIDGIRQNDNLSNFEWVTVSENGYHRARVLKSGIGVNHGLSKLDPVKVREIRQMFLDKIPKYRIAKLFGVSKATIQCIETGKTWAHVE